MSITLLADRAMIAVSGPETRPFLQGLVTSDVERLTPAQTLYAALLTPQGKILFDFLMYERDGSILIDCARDSRDSLMKRLLLYRLRSKVTIEAHDNSVVLASWDGSADPDRAWFVDPRVPELGGRALAARSELKADLLETASYHQHRLHLGVPEASDFGNDRMFALDADLEELHGVSFDKGCYVGQELTARMKHRGTARKRLLPIDVAEGELPPEGTDLVAGGRNIGDITSSYGARGFALVRMDRLGEIDGNSVEAAGMQVAIYRPSWLFA